MTKKKVYGKSGGKKQWGLKPNYQRYSSGNRNKTKAGIFKAMWRISILIFLFYIYFIFNINIFILIGG